MNETDALLVVERGPVPTMRFPLQAEQLTVGRSAGNDLVLADPEVSRRHIRLVRRGEGFAVEDIGSTNGTFVNGQRINHLTLLQDGDAIDLGDTVRLRYVAMVEQTPEESEPVMDTAERPTQLYTPVAPATEYEAPARPAPAPQSRPAPLRPAYTPPLTQPEPAYDAPPSYDYEEPRRGRGLVVGCGLLVALLLVCAGTFLVLDAFDQGRLLYCGPLAAFFEVILGPFGFAPICP